MIKKSWIVLDKLIQSTGAQLSGHKRSAANVVPETIAHLQSSCGDHAKMSQSCSGMGRGKHHIKQVVLVMSVYKYTESNIKLLNIYKKLFQTSNSMYVRVGVHS